MGTLNPPSDPLEAFFISTCGNGVDFYPNEEKEVYVKILKSALAYLPRHQSREFLNVEV